MSDPLFASALKPEFHPETLDPCVLLGDDRIFMEPCVVLGAVIGLWHPGLSLYCGNLTAARWCDQTRRLLGAVIADAHSQNWLVCHQSACS